QAFEPPGFGYAHFHTGVDIAYNQGSPILAADDGVVVAAASSVLDGQLVGYGNYIIVAHRNNFFSLYGHLLGFQVKAGDSVHQGQLIGYEGSTVPLRRPAHQSPPLLAAERAEQLQPVSAKARASSRPSRRSSRCCRRSRSVRHCSFDTTATASSLKASLTTRRAAVRSRAWCSSSLASSIAAGYG
ncbi:MAG: M23 family metallopeptidase, partial [Chloroflexi bacterium]